MKLEMVLLLAALITAPLQAQIQRTERKSLLDADPDVVYMEHAVPKPVELNVVKEAAVFSDKEGKHRLGTLKANQVVHLEAISEKSYRVRGQGTHDGIAGWVAPWAFSSNDPEFVAHLKQLFERQIQVQRLIADQKIAVGMTLEEVTRSRGNPTKTALRKTANGQSGRWEYIDYEDVKNYVTEVDGRTGIAYRRLVSVTRVERGKTGVEFTDNLVTAIEESENRQGGDARIIIPPVLYRW
jgi:hypothetical protein